MEEELNNILNKIRSNQSINNDEISKAFDLFINQINLTKNKLNEMEQMIQQKIKEANEVKEQSIEMNKKYKELKVITDNHKDFIVYVYNSLKENQENTYNLLSEQSEIIESIKSKLTDGEYLKLMNNFKKVNDSVNDINEIYDYVDQNKLMRFLEEEKED